MYKVGDSAEFTKVFSEEDVFLFAGITGDRNPMHTSKEFAAKTRFKERIAHGLLTAGTISAAIGMKLPGPGCLLPVRRPSSSRRPCSSGTRSPRASRSSR